MGSQGGRAVIGMHKGWADSLQGSYQARQAVPDTPPLLAPFLQS